MVHTKSHQKIKDESQKLRIIISFSLS